MSKKENDNSELYQPAIATSSIQPTGEMGRLYEQGQQKNNPDQ
ncbi:hypothetical protein [Undibacterium sp. Tian12W]